MYVHADISGCIFITQILLIR